MTIQRRRPANRKGPRSAEHRKFGSPHLLALQCTSNRSLLASSPETAMIMPTIMKEFNELEQKDRKCDKEITLAATEAIRAVVDKIEMVDTVENSLSDLLSPRTMASSLFNEEMTTLFQRAHELQCPRKNVIHCIDERVDKSKPASYEPLRRSRRACHRVDLLSLSEQSSGCRSLHKRKDIESNMHALEKTRPVSLIASKTMMKDMDEKDEKENKRKRRATKRVKSAFRKRKKTSNRMLSPIQDGKKTTPKKKRSSKARRSLEPLYTFELQTEYVSMLIQELYEEQERDDREMYSITRDTVVTETSSCVWSQEIEDLNMEEFRRLMTYGEVSVESVATTILPLLNLEEDDVFFDLGCGTGKILVQTVLQTPCKRAAGIELMQNRVVEGQKALKRLNDRDIAILCDKQIEIFRGDIFVPPEQARLMDATVVFINNVMFGPALMLKVMELLKDMSKLRCVMTLRKICERHGNSKCTRAGNFCIEYVHPPVEAEIDVSWADKTSVYLYECLNYKCAS